MIEIDQARHRADAQRASGSRSDRLKLRFDPARLTPASGGKTPA
jgi:hypothetical protein